MLCEFFSEFFNFALTSQCKDRIKYSDVDISFSDNIEDFPMLDDHSLLSYVEYRLKKGKLFKHRVNIKYELTEPIEIKYFVGLFNCLHYLGYAILNNATKEQLEGLEQTNTDLQKTLKPTKPNKSLLFEGKDLNLSERYKIANKVLNIDKEIRKLKIKDLEKYQLLAYILGCDKDNARNIMNGTYSSKDRDLSTYFNDLGLNE